MKSLTFVGLMIATVAQAGDTFQTLQTKDGTIYTNAEISSVTAAYAIVFYGNGSGAKIAMTNLPDELQMKYHYDPAKATAEIDAAAMKKQAAQQKQQDANTAQAEAVKDQLYRYVNGELKPISKFEYEYGEVSQVLEDGILLYRKSKQVGTIFIHCPKRGAADGQDWTGYCYYVGTYRYETVNGSMATVPKFETGTSYLTHSDAVLQQLPPLLQPQPYRGSYFNPDGSFRRRP